VLNLKRLGVVLGLAVAAAVALPGAAMAGGDNAQSPLFHVGPNPATCDAGAGGPKSGNVTTHATPDGMGRIDVVIRDGVPNATYQVDHRCVTPIGSLTTNSEGTGTAHINTFSPSALGTYFIDVFNAATNDTYISNPIHN
jgi:hypothetical protein